ncbi:hypothetical protein ACLEPN_30475 [Myxococcus sp. 1LA]
MALTDAEQRVMRELQAKVDGLLSRARAKAAEIEKAAEYIDMVDVLPSWMPNPAKLLIDAARALLANDTERQVVGALRAAEDKVVRWRGPSGLFYGWAVIGKRDDGSDYTVQQWLDLGNEYARELAYSLGELHQASTLTVIDHTVNATEEELAAAARDLADTVVETVKDALPELPSLGLGTKLALTAVGVVAATGVAAIAWEAIKTTPVGLALRGAKLVTQRSVLGTGAAKAGAALRGAVERAEAEQRGSSKPRQRQFPRAARGGRHGGQPVVVNVQLAQAGRGGKTR